MVLGAGCWSPGIVWDAENSAAFSGPRNIAWPYAGCPLDSTSALKLDPNLTQMWAEPPDYQIKHNGSWTWGSQGYQSQSDNALTTIGQRYTLTDGASGAKIQSGNGPYPALPVPSAMNGPLSCPSYRVGTSWGAATLTTTLYVGTNARLSIWGDCTIRTPPGTGYVVQPLRTTVDAPIPSNTNGLALVDKSGNNRNGTAYSPLWQDAGYSGRPAPATGIPGWLSLAGSNASYGLCSNVGANLSSGFTASIWARPYAWGSNMDSMGVLTMDLPQSGNSPNPAFDISFFKSSSSYGNYGFGYAVAPGGGGGASLGPALQPLNWSHIAVTYDGTTLRGYFNGSPGTTVAHTVMNGTGAMRLGGELQWSGTTSALVYPFYGDLAYAMYYPRVLSAAEVSTLYNTPLAPPSGSNVWYPLNYAYPRRVTTQAYGVLTANVSGNPSLEAAMPTFQAQNDVISSQSIWAQQPCYVEQAEIVYNGTILSRRVGPL